jgi:hypothetical protein
MLGNLLVAERLVASKGGLTSLESVSYFCLLCSSIHVSDNIPVPRIPNCGDRTTTNQSNDSPKLYMLSVVMYLFGCDIRMCGRKQWLFVVDQHTVPAVAKK